MGLDGWMGWDGNLCRHLLYEHWSVVQIKEEGEFYFAQEKTGENL